MHIESRPNWRKNVVAVTGVIGSGKSTVARIFRELGAAVVNADELARISVKPGSRGLKQIVEAFGADMLTKRKTLNRKRLASLVFSSPKCRRRLEGITHPMIRKLAEKRCLAAAKKNKLVIYEIPLLFETQNNPKEFRAVVVVAAPKELCIKRLVKDKKLSHKEAVSRLKSQIPLRKKIKMADFVIYNDSTIANTKKQVIRLYRELTSEKKRATKGFKKRRKTFVF